MSAQVSKKTIDDLKEKMRPFVQQMIMAVVNDKPDNVPLYLLTWLQKYGGYTSTGLTLAEKSELEQLRKSIKRYREMEEHATTKEEVVSDEDPDDVLMDNTEIEKKRGSALPRSGVSAEVYGDFNKKENFVARKIPKTPEQIQSIKT